jgi:peptidyl-prolyl cis-trans isomerase D
MVKPFNDFSFDKPIGSIGSVETSYGVHVIEVLDRRKEVEEVEVAKITRQIGASDKTKSAAYSESIKFAIESSDRATLESAAKEAGYTLSEALDIRRKSTSVSGMTKATELVNWAYNAEEGEISQPMLIDNNFVVAILTSSRKKGAPDFDDVEEKMRAGALKKAKGEHYALLMTGGNLDEVAAAAGATVKTALNVNIKTSLIAGSGIIVVPGDGESKAEPEVAGLAFSIPVGEMSNPIVGNHGVWVIAPSKITEAAEKTDFLTEQSALVTQARNGFSFSITNAIRDGSDVVDSRN